MAEVDLEKLNDTYPCNKRTGYGMGCKCKNNGVDTQLIYCEYYRGNVREAQCKNCRYQKKYIISINSENEG